MKNSSVKFKGKAIRTFHVELLLQMASKYFSIYHASNIDTLTVMTPSKWPGDWVTNRRWLKKKKQKRTKRNKNLLHQWKKYKQTTKNGIVKFFVMKISFWLNVAKCQTEALFLFFARQKAISNYGIVKCWCWFPMLWYWLIILTFV